MWLSSPQGTVQVSRPGWRIQAPSVTNAFGWSAGPRGTLFQCSVGTWQQSPQELFKWDKLYQSQPMLLHAHPSPLNHTFETRWSSFFLCLILLFMCFPSLPSRPAQSFGGIKTDKISPNICPSRLKEQKTISKLQQLASEAGSAVCLSINNMSCLSPECTIHYCLCCLKRSRGRKHCILDWRMEQGAAVSSTALPHRNLMCLCWSYCQLL